MVRVLHRQLLSLGARALERLEDLAHINLAGTAFDAPATSGAHLRIIAFHEVVELVDGTENCPIQLITI